MSQCHHFCPPTLAQVVQATSISTWLSAAEPPNTSPGFCPCPFPSVLAQQPGASFHAILPCPCSCPSPFLLLGEGAGASSCTIPGCLAWKVARLLAALGSRVVGSVVPSGLCTAAKTIRCVDPSPFLEGGSDCRGQLA